MNTPTVAPLGWNRFQMFAELEESRPMLCNSITDDNDGSSCVESDPCSGFKDPIPYVTDRITGLLLTRDALAQLIDQIVCQTI